MEYSVPESWVSYMKEKLEHLMKEAFVTSFDKKTKPWFSLTDKEPPFFYTNIFKETE